MYVCTAAIDLGHNCNDKVARAGFEQKSCERDTAAQKNRDEGRLLAQFSN